MELFGIISTILVLCGTLVSTYDIDTFTLDNPFKLQVFIQGYSRLEKSLETLSNGEIIVGDSSFTTFSLTGGILKSQSNGERYYLKNQTGIQYPSYIFKLGQPQINDIGIFGATRDSSLWGRSFLPNITAPEPGAGNLWVACLNSQNLYTIGWDPDNVTPPPAGCTNYVISNPGVLLHIGFV